jgi:hypothetical protein
VILAALADDFVLVVILCDYNIVINQFGRTKKKEIRYNKQILNLLHHYIFACHPYSYFDLVFVLPFLYST